MTRPAFRTAISRFKACFFVAFHSDLPRLKTIIFGNHAFETEDYASFSGETIRTFREIDLPELEEIRLGTSALSGKLTEAALTMKSK